MRLDLNDAEDVPVRLCVRVADEPNPVPGSVKRECDECDTPVWFDPTQRMIHPTEGYEYTASYVLCLNCFIIHAALQNEPPIIVAPTHKREEDQ